MSDGQILNPTTLSFRAALHNTRGATTERPVSTLWNCVLGLMFPLTVSPPSPSLPARSFLVEIKPAAIAPGHEADAVVIGVRLAMPGRDSAEIRQRQIFVAELKNSRHDTTAGWNDAEGQLAQYLNENTNGAERLYAALGIGTKIIFFKWNKSQGLGVSDVDEMIPMHQGTLNFDIATDRPIIERFFEQVKNDG